MVGPINSNLRLFRLARTRRDDFVDGSGHGASWLFWNSRSVQILFRYSCRLGHARFRHFLLDAGMCRVARFVLAFLLRHEDIMASKFESCSPILYSFDPRATAAFAREFPRPRLLHCIIHPRFASATVPIRRDRGRGGSVRAEDNRTWAADWILLSPLPASGQSLRFAFHFHDSRRGIRPDVLLRVLRRVLARDREMGLCPPKRLIVATNSENVECFKDA